MRTFSGKRSTLALAIAGVTAMSGFMAMPEARAEGFIDDSYRQDRTQVRKYVDYARRIRRGRAAGAFEDY